MSIRNMIIMVLLCLGLSTIIIMLRMLMHASSER